MGGLASGEDQGPAGCVAMAAINHWLCVSPLLHRPTSGTRMMTGCCRPWRTETRRRWPRCWARRGRAPPNMTARARPRKLKRLASVGRLWVLNLFSGIPGVPGGTLPVHLWGLCEITATTAPRMLKCIRGYFNPVPFSSSSKLHIWALP